uniref:Uncharacterized protein n=1 Tax=Anguilla anguilla TaxID=7936 RepID=A0A0E9RMC4_ANGAN
MDIDSSPSPLFAPALPEHVSCLFWPHDGGMTSPWRSEQLRHWPISNDD